MKKTTKPEGVTLLPLERVTLNTCCQPRVALDHEAVARYAAVLRDATEDPGVVGELPPVVAFFDGVTYLLADGWLRWYAHRQAGRSHIAVLVRAGGMREARLFAASANARHGAPRTNADRRKAVLMALTDEEACRWSNAQVARHCGVSGPLVAGLRRAHEAAQELERKKAEAAGQKLMAAMAGQAEADEEPDHDQADGLDDAETAGPEGHEPEVYERAGDDADDDLAADEAEDEAQQRAMARERGYRALRKAERFAQPLGLTLEQFVVEFRADPAGRTRAMELEEEQAKRCQEKELAAAAVTKFDPFAD